MHSERIGSMLMDADLISNSQLSEALTYQQTRGGRTVGILIELGALEHDDLYKFLAKRGLPAINPLQCNLAPQITGLLTRDFVLQHEILPVDRLGRLLTVAMVYPFDVTAIQEAESLTGLRVKPVLCRVNEFREAVRRHYPEDYSAAPARGVRKPKHSTHANQAENTLARLRALQDLPSPRHSLGRLSMLHGSGGLTQERMSEVLAKDPVALAKVLAAANAREWTRRRPVIDRNEAVRALGMQGALDVFASLMPWDAGRREIEPKFTAWRESAVMVAETAEKIAKHYGLGGANGIYETGLLHNIGALAFLMLDPQRYSVIIDISARPERRERELELFGITAADAGAELAANWGLPAPVVATIRHLHSPESADNHQDAIAITALAYHIVQTQQTLEIDCIEALRILGLTQSTLRTTILRLHAFRHADAVEI